MKMSNDEMSAAISRILMKHPDLFWGLKPKAATAFLKWWPHNIHIIRAFGKEALHLKTHGKRERYSCYTIREKLRWDSLFREVGTEYKISNNNTPFIARLIMKMNKNLDGMFMTKESC